MKLPFRKPQSKRARILLYIVCGIIAINLLNWAIAFLSSPAAVRQPAFQHFHFRIQVLVDGKAENFASDKYQHEMPKGACAADLVTEPFHFHDKKDQMIHVHWDHMTGGQLLKYYGWNYTGGRADALGYRFDDFPTLKDVPIYGKVLPTVPKDAKFYVYTGDEKSYKQHDFTAFVHQDLEEFLDKQSNLPAGEETSFLDKLFPKAYAHDGEDHSHEESATVSATDKERLEKLNNLLGNVVIFVQKDKPSNEQIKARFNQLAPLSESTCAG
jgi:hypothetical protein